MGLFGNTPEDPSLKLTRQHINMQRDMAVINAGIQEDIAFNQQAEEREQILKWQQDLSQELENFKHELLREININGTWKREQIEVYDSKNNEIKKIDMPPIINRVGVAYVLNTVKRYLNRNTMRSNLSDAIIRRIMKSFGFALALNIAENYDKYELDMSQYHSLNVNSRHIVETTLYRALNNGERINERSIIKMIDAQTKNGEDMKTRGIFGGMKW